MKESITKQHKASLKYIEYIEIQSLYEYNYIFNSCIYNILTNCTFFISVVLLRL